MIFIWNFWFVIVYYDFDFVLLLIHHIYRSYLPINAWSWWSSNRFLNWSKMQDFLYWIEYTVLCKIQLKYSSWLLIFTQQKAWRRYAILYINQRNVILLNRIWFSFFIHNRNRLFIFPLLLAFVRLRICENVYEIAEKKNLPIKLNCFESHFIFLFFFVHSYDAKSR